MPDTPAANTNASSSPARPGGPRSARPSGDDAGGARPAAPAEAEAATAGGAPADLPLGGYEVLVCVCGGIAAYKVAELVSRLVQAGAGVTVALTRSGRRFVGEVTFRALTGRPVHTSMWRLPRQAADEAEITHLRLAERADLIVVAPATANILGKLAGGIADDLVSTLLLGADSPVMLAPAMNTRMWVHPAVQRNVAWLRENGFLFVGPEEGWLACRAVGPGRMSPAEDLFAAVRAQLLSRPAKAGPASARPPSREAGQEVSPQARARA